MTLSAEQTNCTNPLFRTPSHSVWTQKKTLISYIYNASNKDIKAYHQPSYNAYDIQSLTKSIEL